MSAEAPARAAEAALSQPLGPPALLRDAELRPSRLTAPETGACLGVLAGLVVLNVPGLGSNPWPFRPGEIEAAGTLAPLVRLAGGHWDVGLLRSAAMVAGVLLAAYAVAVLSARAAPRTLVGVAAIVVATLVLPSVLLQVALRDATAPWFFTNDSTYQIELAGDLVADGRSPYGHDYSSSGLERFYRLDGTPGKRSIGRHVATQHFAYFPGTALAASAWRALPKPWNDYRVFVALTTIALFFASLAFAGPLAWRLSIGAVLAANPLVIRGAWFGTADAPALLCLLLAFALASRSRYTAAAALLAGAVLLKQFALVAVPFFVVMLLLEVSRPRARQAGAVFLGVLAAGLLPFAAAGPSELWADTIAYGTDTYRIVGYGLAGLLVGLGVLGARTDEYPFLLLALVVWLPVTALLLRAQVRTREPWAGAAGFALSVFLLVFLGRVFHSSYLLWPLVGVAAGVLLAVAPSRRAAVGAVTRGVTSLRPA